MGKQMTLLAWAARMAKVPIYLPAVSCESPERVHQDFKLSAKFSAKPNAPRLLLNR
jgi:hypothetical protein